MKYIFALLLLLSNFAHADNRPWTETEKNLYIAHSALLIADWGQTRSSADRKDLYETNPILGPYPSKQKIDTFFLTQLIGSYYLFDYAQSSRVELMIGFSIARANTVHNNAKLGIKIGF